MKMRWFAIGVALLMGILAVSAMARQASTEPQNAKVLITGNGFEPGSLKLKPNVPAKITFLRQTNDTCATSVVINEFKVKKELPLNEAVLVEVTPRKTGEFVFTCGMFMLKGKLVVSEN